jgi:hypothetical protein
VEHYDGPPDLDRSGTLGIWLKAVLEIPTVFARLVYLCSLRDPSSGRHEHSTLTQDLGEPEADRVIRECHQRTFAQWLCLTLEQQGSDLDAYPSDLGMRKRAVLGIWARLAPYRNLVPEGSEEPERWLYLADLEALVQVVNNQYATGHQMQSQTESAVCEAR